MGTSNLTSGHDCIKITVVLNLRGCCNCVLMIQECISCMNNYIFEHLMYLSVFSYHDLLMTANMKITLIVVLLCILISTKLFFQQMHLLLKHKMLQFIFKISFLIWLLHVSVSCFTVHFDKYKTIFPTNAPFIKT